MDAGTDNGFTFTSPNWETEPRAEVVAIFKLVIIVLVIFIFAIVIFAIILFVIMVFVIINKRACP